FLYATSKLSLQCDLSNREGLRVARKLCDWADVVVESFSPGTMARMGMDFDTLNRDRGDLIMLSTAMLGQNGPLREYAGYGGQAAGFCGLHYITGWPDREPCGVHGPYTDVVAPKFGIAALVSAIHDRPRSGKGPYIDLSPAECSLYFMAPLLLDQAVNGRTAERTGMRSMYSCPHGVFQCAGTQRYIAIEVETTEQWRAFMQIAPLDAFRGERFDSVDARHEVSEQLLEAIAAWAADADPWELEKRLVSAGVPASVVQRPMDVFNDPQIEARGLKQVLRHGECGDVIHYGFPTRFSAKDRMVLSAPPCLGEHNDYILKYCLGSPEDEILKLRNAGAFE
ncbi:MAG: CoA transferase, partial [Pseudomonadales bacterium]|nr:CoA transferase [Pseudomonadales bacterium]